MLCYVWSNELVWHGRITHALLAGLVLGTDSYYLPSLCNILPREQETEMSKYRIMQIELDKYTVELFHETESRWVRLRRFTALSDAESYVQFLLSAEKEHTSRKQFKPILMKEYVSEN